MYTIYLKYHNKKLNFYIFIIYNKCLLTINKISTRSKYEKERQKHQDKKKI